MICDKNYWGEVYGEESNGSSVAGPSASPATNIMTPHSSTPSSSTAVIKPTFRHGQKVDKTKPPACFEQNNAARELRREQLPIDRVRNKIVKVLQSDAPTLIFIGETASGKSTQIPKMCLEAGIAREKKIAVTEPRRVAAQTLAVRVAYEMGTEIREKIGYKFRFEDHTSPSTSIDYMTDGMLLREALNDPILSKYSVVIVDEAHERSVHTDILMFVLKMAQRQRASANAGVSDSFTEPLKIITMSASIDVEKFSEYFNNAPSYYIKGQPHSVQLYHANELSINDNDYLFNALITVCNLHEKQPVEHGFLVFLTGQEEIEVACRSIRQLYPNTSEAPIDAIPLYAALPLQAQAKAFKPSEKGSRKVVFATNIAETSLTIPNIRIVIDTGKEKQKAFVPELCADILKVVPISKEQALQRAGRAGRVSEGMCYRIYSESDHDALNDNQKPEILRSNLSSVLLELISLGMKRPSLRVIDPPDHALLEAALRELITIGAIKYAANNNNNVYITKLGRSLVEFPVHPSHAMILIESDKLGCLEEGLTVVAFMSAESIFTPSNVDLMSQSDEPDAAPHTPLHLVREENKSFYANEGDHVMLIKYYRAYITEKRKCKGDIDTLKSWCKMRNLNRNRLENVHRIRTQLEEICQGREMNTRRSCTSDYTSLLRAICSGLVANACAHINPQSYSQKPSFVKSSQQISTNSYYLVRHPSLRLKIHPSSCLARQHVRHFVFTELIQTTETFARGISIVQEEWIKEFIDRQQCNLQQQHEDEFAHVESKLLLKKKKRLRKKKTISCATNGIKTKENDNNNAESDEGDERSASAASSNSLASSATQSSETTIPNGAHEKLNFDETPKSERVKCQKTPTKSNPKAEEKCVKVELDNNKMTQQRIVSLVNYPDTDPDESMEEKG